MPMLRILATLETHLETLARRLQAPLALAARLYVGWVFVQSGWLKLSDWGQTLALFQIEYRVPLLAPLPAAIAGTAGELVFGALVALGVAGRGAALGLFAVNALAVVSYRHVLLGEGFEAALAQHVLWAVLLTALFLHGPGRWSGDALAATARAGAGSDAHAAGASS